MILFAPMETKGTRKRNQGSIMKGGKTIQNVGLISGKDLLPSSLRVTPCVVCLSVSQCMCEISARMPGFGDSEPFKIESKASPPRCPSTVVQHRCMENMENMEGIF